MWTLFFIQLAGLISPGPDFFYVSRKAASSSLRNALCAAIGISIGVAVWAIVAVFGLSLLSQSTQRLHDIIMILGGSYLFYSGAKMIQVRESARLDDSHTSTHLTSVWQEILKGLAINIANAKIAVFFSSVLSGYVVNLTAWSDILGVLAILVFSALVYFTLVALLFSRSAIRKFYAKYNRYIDNASGAIFLFFGGKLVLDGISGFI